MGCATHGLPPALHPHSLVLAATPPPAAPAHVEVGGGAHVALVGGEGEDGDGQLLVLLLLASQVGPVDGTAAGAGGERNCDGLSEMGAG